jgi:glutamyl-tRNA reductase
MIVFAGLSHTSAPLEVRERCAVPVEERDRVRLELARRFGNAALLTTCGRTEVYVDAAGADRAAVAADLAGWLARRAALDSDQAARSIETATGDDAVRRIVHVASGLASALEGEDEILGQVRRAWLDAAQAETLTPALDAAFRLAVRTGRQARRIGDSHGWTSLADSAAAHVALAVGGQATPRVLIAGSGPMGRRAARQLRDRFGASLDLAMLGRTPERVTAHAAEFDARPLTLDHLTDAFAWSDAAIVGLRVRRPVVEAAHVAGRAPDRGLLVVDLSLPRAVDESVARVAGVTLRNVDHLNGAEGAARSRWDADGRRRVERLVDAAVEEYDQLMERSDAITTLAQLRIRADGVRRAQLARTLRRLPHLDAETRWAVDALTRAIVNRLLHDPTMRLKAEDGARTADQVRDLFGLAGSDA